VECGGTESVGKYDNGRKGRCRARARAREREREEQRGCKAVIRVLGISMGVDVRAVASLGAGVSAVSQSVEGSQTRLRVLRGEEMFANGILILHSLL